MRINSTFAQIGQRNTDGTQNISMYNPSTKTYVSIKSKPTEIDSYVNYIKSKRIGANILGGAAGFGAFATMMVILNKIFPKYNQNPVGWGLIAATVFTIGQVGESFVYTKANKKFIAEHKLS